MIPPVVLKQYVQSSPLYEAVSSRTMEDEDVELEEYIVQQGGIGVIYNRFKVNWKTEKLEYNLTVESESAFV